MNDRTDPLPGDVADLFDAYCNNLIDEQGLRRLEELLRSDEALAREFVAYFHLHSELHFVVRADRASVSALKLIAEEHDPARLQLSARRWRRGIAVASSVVLLIGVIAGSWSLTRHGGVTPPTSSAVAGVPWSANLSTALAMVVRLDGVEWESGVDATPVEGDLLSPGHLRLRAGRLRLSMLIGVSLEVEGPADLELISAERVFCHRGRLRARVPEAVEGFVVSGPGSAVVDMGTEFGLNIDPDGTARGKVFQGKVEAALVTGTGVYRRSRVMTETGRPFAIHPRSGSIEDDASRGEFVERSELARPSLTLDPAYADAVHRSRPWAYWRFDSMAAGSIPDEVAGGPSLRVTGPLHLSTQASGNTSLVFEDGQTEQYLELDRPWEPARRPGHAVELWFQSDAIGHLALASMVTDDSPREGVRKPSDLRFRFILELTSITRTMLHQPASVRFLHRFPPAYWGGDNLYSNHCYVPGRWHHLVGQLNGDRMELFLDAEPTPVLAVDPDYATGPSRLLIGRLTSIPSDPSRPVQAHEHTSRPFVGQIDEVALYDRPLTVEEIRRHHRLASRTGRP